MKYEPPKAILFSANWHPTYGIFKGLYEKAPHVSDLS